MTSAAKYPEGFQLGKCNSLYEETKGTASFRMYPDTTGKKVHIEVWTPDMARRKQKCVAKGTELSTVVYYYQIFVDYSPKNSTKAQLIHLDHPITSIDGEYNAKIGVPVFNKFYKACFELEKMRKDGSWFIKTRKGAFKFKVGGIVGGMEHGNEQIILPPANAKTGARCFELMKDGKLTIVPGEGDTIDFIDNLCEGNFFKTPDMPCENDTIDINSQDISDIGSIGDVVYFKMPKRNFVVPTQTESLIKLIKIHLLEIAHLKEVMFKALDNFDAEKYVKALLHYEANKRYIKTANEELKRITF